MASTTHPEFDGKTEAVDVAKAFSDRVNGKTILITGVNPAGIGFSTAYALVGTIILPHITMSKHISGLPISCSYSPCWS